MLQAPAYLRPLSQTAIIFLCLFFSKCVAGVIDCGGVEASCDQVHRCPHNQTYEKAIHSCGDTCATVHRRETDCSSRRFPSSYGCGCEDGYVMEEAVCTKYNSLTNSIHSFPALFSPIILRPLSFRNSCFSWGPICSP